MIYNDTDDWGNNDEWEFFQSMQEYFTSNEPFGRSLFDGMMDILNNADWREIYQARKILKGKNEKTKRTSDIDTFDGL